MLKTKFQKFHIVIILTTTLFLSSCSIIQPKEKPYTTLYERIGFSWIKDSKCEAGCIFGVEPGKTSYVDAHNILLEIEEIEPGSIENRNYLFRNEEIESISFRFVDDSYRCSISFKNNIAEDIYINGHAGMKIINIGELVEIYGEPDSLLWYNLNPEGKGCFINFLWRDLRMVAKSSDSSIPVFGLDLCEKMEKTKNKVSKDLGIDTIILLTEELFKEFDAVEEPTWNGFLEDN